MVLSACLSAIVFGVNLHRNLSAWIVTWGDGLQLTVYAPSEAVNLVAIQSQLEKVENVAAVRLVSPADTLKEFQVQMASMGSIALTPDDLAQAIPPSFLIDLKKDSGLVSKVALLETTAQKIKRIEGVESVEFGQAWVEQFTDIVHGLGFLWFSLGFLLFSVTGVLIFNAIHVMILERKSEIEILELLGADGQFIRKPYLIEGAILGGVAAIIAVFANLFIFLFFKTLMAKSLSLGSLGAQLSNVNLSLGFYFVLAGTLVGLLSAFIGVRRVNTGWSAAGQS